MTNWIKDMSHCDVTHIKTWKWTLVLIALHEELHYRHLLDLLTTGKSFKPQKSWLLNTCRGPWEIQMELIIDDTVIYLCMFYLYIYIQFMHFCLGTKLIIRYVELLISMVEKWYWSKTLMDFFSSGRHTVLNINILLTLLNIIQANVTWLVHCIGYKLKKKHRNLCQY